MRLHASPGCMVVMSASENDLPVHITCLHSSTAYVCVSTTCVLCCASACHGRQKLTDGAWCMTTLCNAPYAFKHCTACMSWHPVIQKVLASFDLQATAMLFMMRHAALSMIPHAAAYRHTLQQLRRIFDWHLRCNAIAQPQGPIQVLNLVSSL